MRKSELLTQMFLNLCLKLWVVEYREELEKWDLRVEARVQDAPENRGKKRFTLKKRHEASKVNIRFNFVNITEGELLSLSLT